MSGFVTAIPTGLAAFSATNIDDIVILTLFFSQVDTRFRRRHIVFGHYLGFSALVIASLPGFFSSLIVPQDWIGILGIVPIIFGINRLFNPDTEESEPEVEARSSHNSFLGNFFSPEAYAVAGVTIANGSDNIGIYMPLFASSSWENLLVMVAVFLLLVGVWCYVAYQLTRLPAIADTLIRYGNHVVPFVLIGLGVLILVKSHTLENSTLILVTLIGSCCYMVTLLRNYFRLLSVEKN